MADALGIGWSHQLEAKVAVMTVWCIGSYIAYHSIAYARARNRSSVAGGKKTTAGAEEGVVTTDDRDVAGRIVSLMHCVPVTVTSLVTVMTSSPLDFTAANGLEPTLGSFGLCLSVAYFTYDLRVVIETRFHPFVPMVAHHLLSGSCMCLIALAVPRAVWYACLLQATEATAPLNIGIFFLERRVRHKAMALYCAARWLQLLLWLVMREALFVYFARTVWSNWASMPPVMKALGWGTGVPLAAFNTAGLFKVVLKGFPWLPQKQA